MNVADGPDPDAGPRPPARLTGLPSRLLFAAAMYGDRLVSDGLAAEGTRKWHYAVLLTLQEFGPASQSTLSQRSGIYRSDLVAVINELVEQGLVQRAPDPADQRRNVVSLTPTGRRRLRRLDSLVDSLQDDLLAPLTRPEREHLTRLLTRLVEHHAQASGPLPHPGSGGRPRP